MKSYFVKSIMMTLLVASPAIHAELLQKQLTKEISMRYQQIDQKGDESKEEILITNPHFYWMDKAGMSPKIVAEVDLDGTLKINTDVKANHLQLESNGIKHLTINPKNSDDESIEYFLEGKIVDSIDIDFSKIQEPLARLKAGDTSQDTILPLLEAVKSASLEGKNLKMTSSIYGDGQTPTLIDLLRMDYKHTSGETPENFTWNIKSKQKLEYTGANAIYKWPALDAVDSSYESKGNLQVLKKLWRRAPKLFEDL